MKIYSQPNNVIRVTIDLSAFRDCKQVINTTWTFFMYLMRRRIRRARKLLTKEKKLKTAFDVLPTLICMMYKVVSIMAFETIKKSVVF